MLLALLATTTALATPTGSLDCHAIYRQTSASTGRTTETIARMPLTFGAGGVFKYELELEGRYFSLTEEKGQSLLGQIVQSRDSTKGIVNRGEVDASGRFHLAEVDGFALHKMECKKR